MTITDLHTALRFRNFHTCNIGLLTATATLLLVSILPCVTALLVRCRYVTTVVKKGHKQCK